MARAARICANTACPEIVTGATYCEQHKQPAWQNSTRNTKNPPGWQRTRQYILRRDNNTCQYCGNTAQEVDHIRPLSQGGSHAISNLVASCTRCNQRKNIAERKGNTWVPPNNR
jgi:5-methylcytosine-specific restriction endonuclease McrA